MADLAALLDPPLHARMVRLAHLHGRNLKQREIDRFAELGVPALHLGSPWPVLVDKVVFEGEFFSFADDLGVPGELAFTIVVFSNAGMIDIAAWQPETERLSMEASVREPPSSKEARSWFKTSVRQLESATREIVSDVVVWLLPKNSDELLGDPDFAHADLGESQCAVVNSGSPSRDLISSKRNLGLRLSVTQLGRDSQAVAMTPVWRAADGTVAEIMSSNFGGSLLPQGSLVCLSHDANWFLMWTPLAKDQRRSPPLLQRILWIRTAPISGQYDANWHAEAHPHRRPTSFQSYRNLDELSVDYEDLRTSIQEGRQPIKSFHVDDRAGFLIPITSTQLAVLWTGAGTLDADPVDSNIPTLRECKFNPVIKRDPPTLEGIFDNMDDAKAELRSEGYLKE